MKKWGKTYAISWGFLELSNEKVEHLGLKDSSGCKQLYLKLFGKLSLYHAVERLPELIGGLDSLQQKLIYPQEALNNKVEGKVYVKALIDTLGNAICTEIVKGLKFGCNEEAIRLVQMSRFIPAIQRKKKITIPIIIPVIFKLPRK